MKIDDIILNEAPYGMFSRMADKLKSKIPFATGTQDAANLNKAIGDRANYISRYWKSWYNRLPKEEKSSLNADKIKEFFNLPAIRLPASVEKVLQKYEDDAKLKAEYAATKAASVAEAVAEADDLMSFDPIADAEKAQAEQAEKDEKVAAQADQDEADAGAEKAKFSNFVALKIAKDIDKFIMDVLNTASNMNPELFVSTMLNTDDAGKITSDAGSSTKSSAGSGGADKLIQDPDLYSTLASLEKKMDSLNLEKHERRTFNDLFKTVKRAQGRP